MTELEPVRIGNLQRMALSPAHYHCQEQEDDSEESETAAMERGKFAHKHILQGIEIAVSPCRRDPRMKQYQEFLAAAEAEGKLVATRRQEKALRGMKAAVLADPVAPALLTGVIERTMLWTWMGRACRGTPDVLSAHGADSYITELKTTRCSKPEWFQREADRRGYHNQLAWYEHGAMLLDGVHTRELWIVAVESSPPYAVTCHLMEEPRRQQAMRNIRLWMERLLQCESAGHWPAYSEVPLNWGLEERKPWQQSQDVDAEALA